MVDVIAGIKKSDWRKGIRCKMTGQKVESKNSDWHIRQKIKICGDGKVESEKSDWQKEESKTSNWQKGGREKSDWPKVQKVPTGGKTDSKKSDRREGKKREVRLP